MEWVYRKINLKTDYMNNKTRIYYKLKVFYGDQRYHCAIERIALHGCGPGFDTWYYNKTFVWVWVIGSS